MQITITNKSITQTATFARQKYENHQTFLGDSLYTHCVAVARQAEVIAQKLYQDIRKDYLPDSTKDSISAIIQGALLHDVLNVSSCAFEHIAEVATVQIAAMVADISRDFRLVETKRDMEFRGRLSQSPVSAQIVIAADVICTAKDLLRLIEKGGLPVLPKAKKILAQLDGDLLALHAANRYYVLRMYVHAARNLLAEVSQNIKACKHKAKMEKAIAQTTKSLRTKIAAKKAADTSEPVAPKKKGRSRGKRTAKNDSE